MEMLKEALNKLNATIEFCNMQWVIGSNMLLHYVENNSQVMADDEAITDYLLSFKYYDCNYELNVSERAIKEDFPELMTQSGDSELFDSFESAMVDGYWSHVKLICTRYKELHCLENLSNEE